MSQPCSETANITSELGAKPSPNESPKSAKDFIGERYLLSRRERAALVLQLLEDPEAERIIPRAIFSFV